MIGEVLGDPGFAIPLALIQLVAFLLVLRAVDLYEREPLSVLALLAVWGAVAAPTLVIVGREATLGFAPEHAALRGLPAGLVEEAAKGIALVLAFAASQVVGARRGWVEFEGVTDGVVYGAAVGLGFAFTEDVFFLVRQATVTEGLEVFRSRAGFLGTSMLLHALFTGAFGAALGLSVWTRRRWAKILLPLGGLVLAVAMHTAHNSLGTAGLTTVVSLVDYLFLVAAAAAVALWLTFQRRVLRTELAEEVERGLITPAEADATASYLRRMARSLRLVRAGDLEALDVARRLHTELVDLASMKHAARRRGTAAPQADAVRARIARLRDYATTARQMSSATTSST